MDPLTVYAFVNAPHSTDFGDGFTETFPGSGVSVIPSGYVVSVHTQPTTAGTVTVNSNGSGFRVDSPAIPALVNGSIVDSWKWIATKDGEPTIGPFSVPLEIVNAAG